MCSTRTALVGLLLPAILLSCAQPATPATPAIQATPSAVPATSTPPPAAPAATAGLQIVSARSFTGGEGTALFIDGQLQNNTDATLQGIEIVATLYDRAGGVIVTDTVPSGVQALRPGQSSAFHIMLLQPIAYDHCQLQARVAQ